MGFKLIKLTLERVVLNAACYVQSVYVCDARGGRSGVEPDSHLGHGVACTAGCRPTLASEYKTSKISKIRRCFIRQTSEAPHGVVGKPAS